MAFNPAFQPILQDAGVLALGCQKVNINSSSVGGVEDAGFSITGNRLDLKTGYPLTLHSTSLKSMAAVASATCTEFDACVGLLSSIIGSLSTGVVPTVDLDLIIFKPRGKDLTVSFSDVYAKQEFSLDFKNDINTVTFNFEQATATSLEDKITVQEAATVETSFTSPFLSVNNVSIGFSKVGTFHAVQGVSLNLVTEYERLEVGYPALLRKLTPLSHAVTLEVVSEVFTDTAIQEVFTPGTASDLLLQIGLYDGTAITITVKGAIMAQDLTAGINGQDWSTLTKKFIGTGPTLLTIS